MKKMKLKFSLIHRRVVLSFFLLIFFTVIVFLASKIYSSFVEKKGRKEQFGLIKELLMNYISHNKDEKTKIAVYIKDLATEEVVKINENIKIPAASLVKIPLMAAVYYLAEKNELSLDELLTYKKHHHSGGSGKIKHLRYGTKFTLRELVKLMITCSDNIATNMITERIGLHRINSIFKNQLGLKFTNMDRYVMDLRLRDKGVENYTTAEEIALLLEKIYRGELISKKASTEMLNILMNQNISDRIPKYLPQETVVAHKTGLMKNICHDAGIVFTNKGDFIVVVLTEQMDTKLAKNFIATVAYKTYCVYQ